MSDDSAKTLAEKLALSRELALLKPEIDHLRSQVAHQKEVLAEKLALERQLNSLEVELANEKRAAQKATERQESRDNAIEDELRQRIADLENKLTAEQKSSEKAKKAYGKAQSDMEDDLRKQIDDLEKRLASEQKAIEKAQKTTQKVQSDTEEELRQQVADLEKKLADEKRGAQKAKRSQNSDDKEVQANLQEKLLDLEKQLASERQDMDRMRKSSEKEAAVARDQVDMLTQKVEDFKKKLRETRAELKVVRAELTQARTTTTTVVLKDDEPKKPKTKPKTGKKRVANEISVDEMMLDTPGNDEGRIKRPLKKKGIDFTTVGEKSTFSITPFLNKSNTINVSETIEEEEMEEPSILEGKGDSAAPIIEPEPETAEEVLGGVEQQPATSVAKALKMTKSKTTEKKIRGKAKGIVLAQSSADENVKTASSKAEKAADEPEPEAVGKENLSADTAAEAKTIVSDAKNTSTDNPEPKKKKRKLLGASGKGTLFDKDEDAGEVVAPVPTAATAATAAVKRKPVGLKAAARKGPVASLAQTGAFGGKTFSPLKRDRRGVNASFLA